MNVETSEVLEYRDREEVGRENSVASIRDCISNYNNISDLIRSRMSSKRAYSSGCCGVIGILGFRLGNWKVVFPLLSSEWRNRQIRQTRDLGSF
jgi:hypothetical protein